MRENHPIIVIPEFSSVAPAVTENVQNLPRQRVGMPTILVEFGQIKDTPSPRANFPSLVGAEFEFAVICGAMRIISKCFCVSCLE